MSDDLQEMKAGSMPQKHLSMLRSYTAADALTIGNASCGAVAIFLCLDYLATGGSGYFRKGFIRSYLEEGRLALVPDSPEFSYSAYVVHSAKADPGVMDRIRAGLRAAAEIAT